LGGGGEKGREGVEEEKIRLINITKIFLSRNGDQAL
jgi:hypothetical protein